MIEELIQTGSQSLLSVFAPAIAFSAISAVLWAIIRLVKNDPKKAQYKTIPGPKGKFLSEILLSLVT